MIVILAMFALIFFDTSLIIHIIIALMTIVTVLLLQVSIIKLSGQEEFPI